MKDPDEPDDDPEDMFEQLEPTEPDRLDNRIRDGEAIEPDEIGDEDWDAIDNYFEYLEDQRLDKPAPNGDQEPEGDKDGA